MALGLKFFLTHVFSAGPAKRDNGTVFTNDTNTNGTFVEDLGRDFVALGVLVGDVVRFTAPDSLKGQAGVVQSVSNGNQALSFYVAVQGDSDSITGNVPVGANFQVEAPRQGEDLSGSVLRLEMKDGLADLASECIVELANGAGAFEGKFSARDPVEVWLEDDDADSAAVTMPSSVTDTTAAAQASRCFVGRVDRIERLKDERGEVMRLVCRDYTADLLDTPADAVFINEQMLPVAGGRSVFGDLRGLFNGTKAQSPSERDDEVKAGKCGDMRDRATGRPTFAGASSALASGIRNPKGDVALATESFFDGYAKLAGICSDPTAGMFLGEPCKFWVDSFTYHPRRQNATGVGQDVPRPPPGDATLGPGGAGTGPGNPTINVKTPTDAKGAALSWALTEGTNLVRLEPMQDTERTRNTVTLQGTRSDELPVVMLRRQRRSLLDAHGQPVLGRDRYGEMGNVSRASGFFDATAADAAATSALIRTRAAKERRTLTRVGVVEPGRRLSGAVVTVNAQTTAGFTGSLGIAAARHTWEPTGFLTSFDLTHIRPGWDRLLAPIEKRVRDVIQEDVWKAWQVYVADVAGNQDVTFKRVAAHAFGTSSEETSLFTVTKPSTATYPVTPASGNDWQFVSFRFLDGLLLILWAEGPNVANPWRILVQVVNAYDGGAWLGSDGVYATHEDGSALRMPLVNGAAVQPADLWALALTTAAANPTSDAVFHVWVNVGIGANLTTFALVKLNRAALTAKDPPLRIVETGIGSHAAGGRFFILSRDDGHIFAHTTNVNVDIFWHVVDLGDNPPPSSENQDKFSAGKDPVSLSSDRRNLAVYVSGDVIGGGTNDRLKLNTRFGQQEWERDAGSGIRNLTSRGRIDAVPYTRFYIVP